jgi:hypothetical protein
VTKSIKLKPKKVDDSSDKVEDCISHNKSVNGEAVFTRDVEESASSESHVYSYGEDDFGETSAPSPRVDELMLPVISVYFNRIRAHSPCSFLSSTAARFSLVFASLVLADAST